MRHLRPVDANSRKFSKTPADPLAREAVGKRIGLRQARSDKITAADFRHRRVVAYDLAVVQLPETVVGLADGSPERLVVDVKHLASMELASADRRRESPLDQHLEEVRALLAMDDASEAAGTWRSTKTPECRSTFNRNRA